jgi:hypothetical protein
MSSSSSGLQLARTRKGKYSLRPRWPGSSILANLRRICQVRSRAPAHSVPRSSRACRLHTQPSYPKKIENRQAESRMRCAFTAKCMRCFSQLESHPACAPCVGSAFVASLDRKLAAWGFPDVATPGPLGLRAATRSHSINRACTHGALKPLLPTRSA